MNGGDQVEGDAMRRWHSNDLILSILIALVVVVIALAVLGLLRR